MTTLASRVQPLERASRRLGLSGDLPAALLGLAAVAPVASVDGGYAPSSWGWVSLGLAWAAIVAIVLRGSLALSRLELLAVGALSAFAGWTLLSATWSGDVGGSVLATERLLVYVTALAAAFAVVQARTYRATLVGVWIASTLVCGYAALTRLYPDRFRVSVVVAGNRLSTPVGYWNSLGLLAVLGLLLAVGFAVSRRSRVLAALAGASLVPLALACYFTFSRGAWLVLAVGTLVTFAMHPHRLRYAVGALAVGAWAGVAVWLATKATDLTTATPNLALAGGQGAQLARVCIVLAAWAGVTAIVLAQAARTVRVPRAARTAFAASLLAILLFGVTALGVRYGSPSSIAQRAWRSFTSNPQPPTNLNKRLFTLAGGGRVDLWRVALHDFAGHPLLGSGAATYERTWLERRPVPMQVVNAHNLYLETLAELGPVGLALLLVALLAPLVAAMRARARGFVPAAAGAYAAFLVHELFDWDWQLPGVTVAALLVGAALLVAARAEEREPGSRTWPRHLAAGALVCAAAVSALALVGNRAAGAAVGAAAAGRFDRAVADARRAERWQPWSSRPWQILGEAQLEQGQLPQAAASFRRTLAKSPDDWRLWLDLALASSTRAERRHAALRALELNPLSPEIAAIRGALGLAPAGQR